jgi:MFS family permease
MEGNCGRGRFGVTGLSGMTVPPALRYQDFRRFWVGASASAIGTQFTTVAMAWQIYEITGSPLQLGFLGLARAIPQMAVLLFGGVLADRLDRRRILVVMQLVQFGVSGSLSAITISGHVTPLVLYAASVLLALCTAFETPARQALIPNLVPPTNLTSALALNSTQRDVGNIVGPALGGLLLALSGPAACYAVDAMSWLAMFIALLNISKIAGIPGPAPAPALQSLAEGLAFVWAHPVILSCMVLDFGATFFGSARALYPIYARDILMVGGLGLGLLYASSAVGSVIAATVMSSLPHIRRAGFWTLVGVAIYGACATVFALSNHFWLSLALLAGTGAGNIVSAILRGTINQLNTPNHLRGRVSAVNAVFVQGGPQLGQFESGLVAQIGGAQFSALTGGVATLILVAIVAATPWVRSYELPPPAEPELVAQTPAAS